MHSAGAGGGEGGGGGGGGEGGNCHLPLPRALTGDWSQPPQQGWREADATLVQQPPPGSRPFCSPDLIHIGTLWYI